MFCCLQRNGVEVTVLEARERVGGRVHTLRDARFAAPVDLGASLITGTRVRRRTIPRAFVSRLSVGNSMLAKCARRTRCPVDLGASLITGAQVNNIFQKEPIGSLEPFTVASHVTHAALAASTQARPLVSGTRAPPAH